MRQGLDLFGIQHSPRRSSCDTCGQPLVKLATPAGVTKVCGSSPLKRLRRLTEAEAREVVLPTLGHKVPAASIRQLRREGIEAGL